MWQCGIGKFKSWSIREHSVEVGHLADEGLVVNFMLPAVISKLGFEVGTILIPLFLVFLNFLQQFLEGLLWIVDNVLSFWVMKTFSAASSLSFHLSLLKLKARGLAFDRRRSEAALLNEIIICLLAPQTNPNIISGRNLISNIKVGGHLLGALR